MLASALILSSLSLELPPVSSIELLVSRGIEEPIPRRHTTTTQAAFISFVSSRAPRQIEFTELYCETKVSKSLLYSSAEPG